MHININGARGSGKTHMLCAHAITMCLSRDNYDVGIYVNSGPLAAHTMTTLRRIIELNGTDFKSATKNSIVFRNGSAININSVDKAYGNRHNAAMIDNIDLLKEDQQKKTLMALSNSRLLFTSSIQNYTI